MSDNDVLAAAMLVIKKWYPSAPDYISYKRSNWGSEPYSTGAYSFVKAGATPDDCELYYENIDEKIYFAGEATTCELIGTVHGALITGEKAANTILNHAGKCILVLSFAL